MIEPTTLHGMKRSGELFDGVRITLPGPLYDEIVMTTTTPGPYVPPPRGSLSDIIFEDNVAELFEELQSLLLSKHADYGPTNVSKSPGGALNGLRVRVWDKTARINHLIDNRDSSPRHEALEDSFIDLANYCVIAVMVLRNQWPSE